MREKKSSKNKENKSNEVVVLDKCRSAPVKMASGFYIFGIFFNFRQGRRSSSAFPQLINGESVNGTMNPKEVLTSINVYWALIFLHAQYSLLTCFIIYFFKVYLFM